MPQRAAYAGTAASARRAPPRRSSARRPSARRPGARRRPSRVRWDRVGRLALTLVLGVILLSYLNPALNFVHVYRGTSVAKAELRGLQRENGQLEKSVDSANDPAVLEREARRQGMVEPGEQSVVIIPSRH